MALETRNSDGTVYLQLDYGKKSMYIYNPEEKEGFEKHTTEKGKVSYRKYVNAVTGKITSAYFRDGNFGQEFILIFSDDEGKYSVQMGIEDSVFQNLGRSIENIDTSETVRLSIYDSKSKTNNKSYFGLSLSYPEVLDNDGKAKLVEWGEELPRGKQLKSGKWDFSLANDEVYGRVESFIKANDFDKFDSSSNKNDDSSSEESKPSKETKSKASKEDDDDEDLPF